MKSKKFWRSAEFWKLLIINLVVLGAVFYGNTQGEFGEGPFYLFILAVLFGAALSNLLILKVITPIYKKLDAWSDKRFNKLRSKN